MNKLFKPTLGILLFLGGYTYAMEPSAAAAAAPAYESSDAALDLPRIDNPWNALLKLNDVSNLDVSNLADVIVLPDHILGVGPDADLEAVQDKYQQRLAAWEKISHPDARRICQILTDAHELLMKKYALLDKASQLEKATKRVLKNSKLVQLLAKEEDGKDVMRDLQNLVHLRSILHQFLMVPEDQFNLDSIPGVSREFLSELLQERQKLTRQSTQLSDKEWEELKKSYTSLLDGITKTVEESTVLNNVTDALARNCTIL